MQANFLLIMKIKEVISALERFAPLPLQDGFDNAGLQIGLTEAETTGALLCLDVTEETVDEAIRGGYNLIISHHPLIFKGYKSITGRDYVERCILKAIKNDVVIYSAHTNLDNATGGVNWHIARKLGLSGIEALEPRKNSLLKLVTFVPVAQAEKVRQALFEAGCGHIGNYDACSYNLEGQGTFRAQEGTHPFCGTIGEMHLEKEIRIETILPSFKKTEAVRALIAAHPYEEPAFDLYPLQNEWTQAGAGIIGTLEEPEEELDFLRRIKKIFKADCLRHGKLCGRAIRKVAVCGGAGAFLIPQAIGRGADVFITGEIKYHEYFGYESKILLAETGHYESEQYTPELLRSVLQDAYPEGRFDCSEINTNPINYL